VRDCSTFSVKARKFLWSRIEAFGESYLINNPEKLTLHRFTHIFHQVRHPLRVVNTLFSRCHHWDRYWVWISKLSGFELLTAKMGGKRRAMLLYLLWNRHIEAYADLRFRTETTSVRDLCRWAGFNSTACSHRPLAPPLLQPTPVNRSSPSFRRYTGLSWAALEDADPVLAFELQVMCLQYGYPLDPDLLPQSADTFQFTA